MKKGESILKEKENKNSERASRIRKEKKIRRRIENKKRIIGKIKCRITKTKARKRSQRGC
jgi:hypothetical protein